MKKYHIEKRLTNKGLAAIDHISQMAQDNPHNHQGSGMLGMGAVGEEVAARQAIGFRMRGEG